MRELIDTWAAYDEEHQELIDDGYYRSLNEYQDTASEFAIYDNKVIYPVLGLTSEAGEVADKMKKLLRDKNLPIDEEKLFEAISIEDREELAKELGDCLWYISQMASDLGFCLSEVAQMNLDKLKDRSNRNVIRGSGDNR